MNVFKTALVSACVLLTLQMAQANTAVQDPRANDPSHPGTYGHLINRSGEQILVARDFLP
jgi:hypothetical protein